MTEATVPPAHPQVAHLQATHPQAAHLQADVAIVGGGIVSSSAALFLRRHGLSVVLLERGRCGAAASGVNCGGVRVQGRSLVQLPLALRARQLWAQLPALIGMDGEYQQTGHLKLARSDADIASLQHYARLVDGQGLGLQLISGQAFRRAYPWLGGRAIAGSWCPGDGHANPRLVSPAFASASQAAGARVIEGCEVTELAHNGSRFVLGNGQGLLVQAPWLLNCAGAWALPVARALGDDAPLHSIHPGMAVTEPLPQFMAINIGVEGGGIYGRQTARSNCVMGGSRSASTGPAVGEALAHWVHLGRAGVPLAPFAISRFSNHHVSNDHARPAHHATAALSSAPTLHP